MAARVVLIVARLCASRNLSDVFLQKPNKNHHDVAACSGRQYSAYVNVMLQAHSPLWHYLWVAPNVLLLILALLLWRRRLHQRYPIFFTFAIVGAIEQLVIYAADVIPSVAPGTWWLIFWAGLVVEGLLKFVLVGEIFAHILDPYPSLARAGKFLIRGVGTVLILAAALAAALTSKNGLFGIVSGAHLLEQTIYLIEAGLLVSIFALSSYFRLSPARPLFGIALGLSISACVHLGTWAVMANGGLPKERNLLDLLNMATYHVCVLIWFYYLLVPSRVAPTVALPLPENSLEVWNRELERLVQQRVQQ